VKWIDLGLVSFLGTWTTWMLPGFSCRGLVAVLINYNEEEAPSVRRTQSEGDTLELLQTTYFPNLEITEEMAAPPVALRARR
jgi:hypothetical protein